MSPLQGSLALLPLLAFRGLATSPEKHLLGDTNMPTRVFLVNRIPPAHPTAQACPAGFWGVKILGFDPISLKSYHSLTAGPHSCRLCLR